MRDTFPFRYFITSPEIIRLAVMMYVRSPLSLRNEEDLLHERDIDISHVTVRFWLNKFGPINILKYLDLNSSNLLYLDKLGPCLLPKPN